MMQTLSKLRTRLSSLYIAGWTTPLSLLVMCMVTFGWFLPQLGFYWDDWEPILILKTNQLSAFQDYVRTYRPTSIWVYYLFGPLLGIHPIGWHILALLLRWLTVVTALWTLNNLWQSHQRENLFIALLFCIYPTFFQQSLAVSYYHHWLAFLLYFISILAMIKALRHPQRFVFWTTLALITLLLHLSVMEYFVGLELIRPLILYYLLKQSSQQKQFKKTLLHWLSYLITLGVYVFWRLQFSSQITDDPNRPVFLMSFLERPWEALKKLSQMAVQDLVYVLFASWYKTVKPASFSFSQPFNIFSFGIATILAGFIFLYLLKIYPDTTDASTKKADHWFQKCFVFGITATLFGLLPIWTTGRQASIEGMFADRFALASMFGASILTVLLIEWFIQKNRKTVALCVLLLLGIALNLRTANEYRWSWVKQQRTYWQLFWRAPKIEPGTVLLSDAELFPYVFPTFAFNTLYPQVNDPANLHFWFYYFGRGFASDTDNWLAGKPIEEHFRGFSFHGHSYRSLVLFQETGQHANCLWVLNQDDFHDPYLTDTIRAALPLSDLSRIRIDSNQLPPKEIFGSEPPHEWCYFYEKADLLQQYGEWDDIATLADTALQLGYTPTRSQSNSPHEWLPFIEAYARTGHWQKAKELTLQSYATDHNYQLLLCNLWNTLQNETAPIPENQEVFPEVINALECLQ
ncbi:MAG: hypothetical protein WHV66_01060 [Anaerolineales bacterium]